DHFLSDALQGAGVSVPAFSVNGMQISFFSTLISIGLYVGVSLLTCRQNFPLNKMLHRDELPRDEKGRPIVAKRPWTFGRVIGVDANFSKGDKWIAGGLFGWSVLW